MEPVRTPLRGRKRSGRTLDQRLGLRFPGLAAVNLRLISRLPPSSALRRRALARVAELALDAFNRRDLEAVVIGVHPEFEYHPEPSWVEAGVVEPCDRGRDEYFTYIATVDEVWQGQNFLTPKEVIDLGDRFVMLADAEMRASTSGVELSQEYGAVSMVRDGQVVRMEEYFNHARALASVGLAD